MKIEDLLVPDEKIQENEGDVYLTNKRIIRFRTIFLQSFFKDMPLDNIESIEHSKKRFLWILGVGFAIMALTLLIGSLFPELMSLMLLIGIGSLIFAGVIFFFIVDQEIIIFGSQSTIKIHKKNIEFIRKIRKASL